MRECLEITSPKTYKITTSTSTSTGGYVPTSTTLPKLNNIKLEPNVPTQPSLVHNPTPWAYPPVATTTTTSSSTLKEGGFDPFPNIQAQLHISPPHELQQRMASTTQQSNPFASNNNNDVEMDVVRTILRLTIY